DHRAGRADPLGRGHRRLAPALKPRAEDKIEDGPQPRISFGNTRLVELIGHRATLAPRAETTAVTASGATAVLHSDHGRLIGRRRAPSRRRPAHVAKRRRPR